MSKPPSIGPGLFLVIDQAGGGDVSQPLQAAGYKCLVAAVVEEAIARAEQEETAVSGVFLSFSRGPDETFAELAALRRNARLFDVPVIVLFSVLEEHEIAYFLRARCFSCLVRPLVPALLVGLCESAREHRKQQLAFRARRLRDRRAMHLMGKASFTFRTLEEGAALADLLAEACPRPEMAYLGIQELFINAIEHGNLEINFEMKARLTEEGRWRDEVDQRLRRPGLAERRVVVELERSAHELRLAISDEGTGFDWRSFLTSDPGTIAGAHGRGIALARLLSFDRLEYRGTGNQVVGYLRLEAGASPFDPARG